MSSNINELLAGAPKDEPLMDHEDAKSAIDEPKTPAELVQLFEVNFTREKFNYVCNWMLKLNDEDAAAIYPILNQIRQAHKA